MDKQKLQYIQSGAKVLFISLPVAAANTVWKLLHKL